MHPIITAVEGFLAEAAKGNAPFNEALLDQMLLDMKDDIKKEFFTAPDDRFRLRMSNIGRDARHLMLEEKYGREPRSSSFILKMLTGLTQEHLLVFMLRSAGMEVETAGKCSLYIDDKKIDGEWDLRLSIDGKIYDVKTASEWSYKNKFESYDTLAKDDTFGYIDQLLGYCVAENCEAGGWVVLNKSTGEIKVIEYPYNLSLVKVAFKKRIAEKIRVIESGEMPPCTGVQDELFYKKPTGNKILGFKCKFCSHKDKCHPGISYEPSRVSTAQNPKYEYYIPTEEPLMADKKQPMKKGKGGKGKKKC